MVVSSPEKSAHAADSTMVDPAIESVLEEVRQLRIAMSLYRTVVERLLEKEAA
jgi:hypothetical protein